MHKIEVTGASDLASLFLHQGCFCITLLYTHNNLHILKNKASCNKAEEAGNESEAAGWYIVVI